MVENGFSTFPDVYSLTLAELNSIINGKLTIINRDNMRVGSIIASIYNVNRTKKTQKVFNWTDFFTDLQPEKRVKSPMSNEDISEKLHGMFGGK